MYNNSSCYESKEGKAGSRDNLIPRMSSHSIRLSSLSDVRVSDWISFPVGLKDPNGIYFVSNADQRIIYAIQQLDYTTNYMTWHKGFGHFRAWEMGYL